ncbi:PucR family transcriptional regulator [Caloramator proteoclasticus]|uniref:PucR C-terminal helix-turn-helix domain-containing protein n=1 Tax=Caloramator proteoclasticus DSM 10124 TaxID=1121262 RepID=A0A1M5AAY4_9CLOT|nr:helix-turn-helix domain-containing protein [Caloramator proteoclasticus]SHF27206.1 PucR C-terminal helix-turn-helix domain-containing protein [Caloramator proteoclasticus DSM 10124]
MAFCENLKSALKAKVSIYDSNGNIVDGEDLGFVFTKDLEYKNGITYINASKYIIAISKEISQDAINLVRMIALANIEEAAGFMQPLEYILKNDVQSETLRGRFSDYSVLYIKSKTNFKDLLESIYESTDTSIIQDDEGIYIVKVIDDLEQEADSIIDGISQEAGSNVLIGASRRVGASYTIKDAANHAKQAANLASILGFKEGFYHIDKMLMYGILYSCSDEAVEYYMNGGFNGFYDVIKDKELLDTAEELFKCHLNVSEASRKLYLHRNTLLYRLEKIKNLTGLDIKRFEEAVIFRTVVALYKLKRR